MTREDEDIEGGSENFKTPERGALKKIVGLGGRLRKFVYFKTNGRRGAPKKLNCR